MTDDNLKRKLRELVVPAPDKFARDRAWHRARVAFLSSGSGPTESLGEKPPAGFAFFRWALPIVVVVAAAVIWLLALPSRENTIAWNRLLQEMETLFPNRLNAVVERDGAFEVELSEENPGAPGQPIIMEFRRGSHALRVLGFSGRRVCVDLGGVRACFEPLVTGEGTVILSGENFFWSPEHPAFPDGLRIRVRTMPSA